MRIEKLTTKFQEALSEAQTLALGKDHAFIEPAHVVAAMLHQDDGPKALLQRAGVNHAGLLAVAETCLLYTSPSPRDRTRSRMPSSA